nr:hypothetical protein [Actinomadura violacea]
MASWPGVAEVVDLCAADHHAVLGDPDLAARALGVDGDNTERADQDVVDVGTAASDGDGVQDVPAVLARPFVEPAADDAFGLRAHCEVTGLGAKAEECGEPGAPVAKFVGAGLCGGAWPVEGEVDVRFVRGWRPTTACRWWPCTFG